MPWTSMTGNDLSILVARTARQACPFALAAVTVGPHPTLPGSALITLLPWPGLDDWHQRITQRVLSAVLAAVPGIGAEIRTVVTL